MYSSIIKRHSRPWTIKSQKLLKYGFGNTAINWVESYLGNRRHTVKCIDICSKPVSVRYGVPQRSVMGPLCFIMYVNDLISHIEQHTNANILMYADDTVLLTKKDNLADAVLDIQEVLAHISAWCIRNKLTINANKTKHMLVLRNQGLADGSLSRNVRQPTRKFGNVRYIL